MAPDTLSAHVNAIEKLPISGTKQKQFPINLISTENK